MLVLLVCQYFGMVIWCGRFDNAVRMIGVAILCRQAERPQRRHWESSSKISRRRTNNKKTIAFRRYLCRLHYLAYLIWGRKTKGLYLISLDMQFVAAVALCVACWVGCQKLPYSRSPHSPDLSGAFHRPHPDAECLHRPGSSVGSVNELPPPWSCVSQANKWVNWKGKVVSLSECSPGLLKCVVFENKSFFIWKNIPHMTEINVVAVLWYRHRNCSFCCRIWNMMTFPHYR